MARRPSGRRATGQHIYLPTRTVDGSKVELADFESYSENTGAATTETETLPSGASESVVGEVPINSMSIQLRFQPHNPDHQYLVASDTVTLEFAQDEILIETPGAAARVAVATDGEITFSGSGNASAGSVGDAIKIGDKYYVIRTIRPDTGHTEVDPTLSHADNKIFVDATAAGGTTLTAVVATAYTIVSPAASTGNVAGKMSQKPRLGDIPNDVSARRTATFIFTPDTNIPRMNIPSANRPT